MNKKIIYIILGILLIIIALNYKLILKQLYPVRYNSYVEKYAEENEIDPMLVYAVIKNESKFNPFARSHRGACGLMQITPKTGEYIAKLLKEEGYNESHLLIPEISIRYGCFYIAKLSKNYGGDIATTLAAYNAGEGNVKKWIEDGRGEDNRIYEDSIPFGETKKYVKNIKKDYAMYKFLYTKTR